MKAQQPTKLILHQYDYPGWQARLDDSLTLAVSANRQGLLQVWIPAGQHTLTLKLAARWPERWGIGLSLLGWLCWLVLACLGAKKPKKRVTRTRVIA
ncbi:hypothetical protein OB934_02785 [Aeromonas salmonicida]|uniref:hypothetical protein n=1 Tax=Aeromonas salmonicida TaxID=645 RepID=UPI00259DF6E3|nr:hypothetical protein [Aeromonas salmonicida]MDM5061745.1 hypothetical protein [Aeromonas salmonicida]